MHYSFAIFISCFLVYCSSEIDFNGTSSEITNDALEQLDIKENKAEHDQAHEVIIQENVVFTEVKNDATAEPIESGEVVEDVVDEEEEIQAIRPTIISGAYLVCQPDLMQADEQNLFISCHFEKDSEMIDFGLGSSMFVVTDSDGNELSSRLVINNAGEYKIAVTLNESKDISIKVETASSDEKTPELSTQISGEDIDASMNQQEIEGETPQPEAEPATEVEQANTTLDCSNIGVFGDWVRVPGDNDYNTLDFCVMKYEAKNVMDIPTSSPEGLPWVHIKQVDAINRCKSLGSGFRLINNAEWMTMASNIAATAANWSLGAVGQGHLTRGHSDSGINLACPAYADDSIAFAQQGCEGQTNGDFNQRRTFYLSTNDTLWDVSGNVSEWVYYVNPDQKPAGVGEPVGFIPRFEFSNVASSENMLVSELIPTNGVKEFWNDSWDSSRYVGMYRPGEQGSGGAMVRGGFWYPPAGIFDTSLVYQMEGTSTRNSIGFRCTYSPESPSK